MSKKKADPPKLRKGQKCWKCKKEIKKGWCWNGYFWHEKCKDKDSAERIKEYLKKSLCLTKRAIAKSVATKLTKD